MAAAIPPSDTNVCFAELIVRLDSLLTLRDNQEDVEQNDEEIEDLIEAKNELEVDIKRKLTEIHLRLKNGGSIHDGGHVGDDDEEDEAVEDTQGPLGTEGAVGSVDCVGCSSAEDDNEVCPSPIQPKARKHKISLRTMKLMNHDNINALLRLSIMVFLRDSYSNETLALAAQLLAEICRENDGRKIALRYRNSQNISLVQSIGQVLSSKPRATETCVQICRIIGNLCYECNEGREQIMREAEHIFESLVKAFENRTKEEDPGQRLPVIFPGCLLNFCNETPQAVETLAKFKCAESIIKNILNTKTNDAVFNSSILFIHAMVECETGVQHLSRCAKFPEAIWHVLENTTSPEVCSTLFDMLKTCSEAPALVLHLSKGGLFEYMVTHMNRKLQSDAFRQLRVTSCDIFVTLLSHDEAMQYAYDQDKKLYINTFLEWLKEGDDVPLKVTAALSMGNLCCSSQNCQELIGVFPPVLIQALKDHQAPLVRDVKLQHAILGALRNLAVSPAGRHVLLENDILPPCLDLISGLSLTPITHPVVMKLLATLRLLVESEASVSICLGESRPDVLAQIINYGNHEGAGPGPKAESGRLLAGILKNCQSKKAMKNVINMGGLPSITVMLHSSHARMLNEAIVSLTTLTASLASSEETSDQALVHRHLHTDLVINGVIKCLNNADLPGGLHANAATYVKALLKVETDAFKQMLKDMNFVQQCNCFSDQSKLSSMPKEVQDLHTILK